MQILCSNNLQLHSTQKAFITTTVPSGISIAVSKIFQPSCDTSCVRSAFMLRENLAKRTNTISLFWGYLLLAEMGSHSVNDCTVSLPREKRKRQNMTWWLDRASLYLSDKTCCHPADFPFVSIECELRWPYFLIWH